MNIYFCNKSIFEQHHSYKFLESCLFFLYISNKKDKTIGSKIYKIFLENVYGFMKYCQFYFEKHFPAIIQTPLRQNFKYQAEKFMKSLEL